MISCILTIIKDEHLYLDEWLRYHLSIGVSHIFVFEDIESLSHKEITDNYPQVTLLNVLDAFTDEEKIRSIIEVKKLRKYNPQVTYFREALSFIKSNYPNYDWCFAIDVDEYITLNNGKSLSETMALYEGRDAVVLQWECYGANGLIYKPNYKDKGLVDTYTEKAKGQVPDTLNHLTKGCYNLQTYEPTYFAHQHWPDHRCKWCRSDLSRKRLTPIYDNIYLRHYITKSWEEYLCKRKRGFMAGGTRTIDFFFNINPDMKDKKNDLLKDYMKDKTLVILPYCNDKAQGNEIELALNAWHKFCTFEYHFVVVGTFPEYLRNRYNWVEFIKCNPVKKIEGQYYPHLDIQHKFEVVKEKYGEMLDGFIEMTDDFYAIKPFTLEDIMIIYYHSLNCVGDKNKPTHYWAYDKWKTRQLLDREGLPHINYTAHFPCYYDWKKINEIWDKFNMRNESYVLEDVYYNYFSHPEPIIDSSIRLGIWNKQIYMNQFHQAIQDLNVKFICNSVEGWSKELEDDLWKIIK